MRLCRSVVETSVTPSGMTNSCCVTGKLVRMVELGEGWEPEGLCLVSNPAWLDLSLRAVFPVKTPEMSDVRRSILPHVQKMRALDLTGGVSTPPKHLTRHVAASAPCSCPGACRP